MGHRGPFRRAGAHPAADDCGLQGKSTFFSTIQSSFSGMRRMDWTPWSGFHAPVGIVRPAESGAARQAESDAFPSTIDADDRHIIQEQLDRFVTALQLPPRPASSPAVDEIGPLRLLTRLDRHQASRTTTEQCQRAETAQCSSARLTPDPQKTTS